MNNYKVSIITVSYNSVNTISRTIESVLTQTYTNIEYIIIDGASSDGTQEIIKQYEPEFMGRLRWVSEPDEGIYYAMNKGIAMATGELIGIINSDDWYEKDAVEKMIVRADVEKYQILYGMLCSWKDDKLVSISWRSHELLNDGMIAHPACFVTKKVYDELGMYNVNYKSVADYDFMLQMVNDSQVSFVPVYELVANFSLGGMCSSSKAWLELVNLQKKWNIISSKQYYTILIKDFLYKLVHFELFRKSN